MNVMSTTAEETNHLTIFKMVEPLFSILGNGLWVVSSSCVFVRLFHQPYSQGRLVVLSCLTKPEKTSGRSELLRPVDEG